MARDLGVKHLCFKCGTKFYDLRKPIPLCPKCGADQRETPSRGAPPPGERRRAKLKVVDDEPVRVLPDGEEPAAEDDEEPVEEEEEAEDLI